jgi:Tol biopolymer transport system component
VYNRQGQILTSLGKSSYWSQAAFSPYGNRLAVIKNDLLEGTSEVWTFDLARGTGSPITNDGTSHGNPVWSPDGSQLAYVSFRNGASGIYRKSSDGSGAEEALYRHPPGTGIVLTDWSADGRVLSFWSQKALYSLPLEGVRQAVLVYRDEANNRAGRFSPDGRYLAYSSDRSGRFETYVAPFSGTAAATPPGVQVSNTGALGGIFWRQDQRELYFVSDNRDIMAADVSADSEFRAATPRLLFRLASPLGGPGQLSSIGTRDGQRFVFAEDVR